MGQIITFGPSSIRARRRKPRSMFYDQGASSNPAIKLLKEALLWLQPSGIEDTAGNVTAWRNIGTGGSAYDFTNIAGAVTVDTLNGQRVVRTDGEIGTWLKTSANRTIAQPFTCFHVCKFDSFGAIGNDYMMDSFTLLASRAFMRRDTSNGFRVYAGTAQTMLTPNDFNTHAFGVAFNGAGSVIVTDNRAPVTTSLGTYSYIGSTLCQQSEGGGAAGTGVDGITAFHAIIPRALASAEIAVVNSYLMKLFAI